MANKYSNKFVQGLLKDIDNHYMKNTSHKECINMKANTDGANLALQNIKGHILRSDFKDIPNVIFSEKQTIDNIYHYAVFTNEIVLFGSNDTYDAIIFSIRVDDNGNAYSRLLWRGILGWGVDTVISAKTNWENELYKRVYFTDGVTSIKSINIAKDNLLQLWSSTSKEISLNSSYSIPTISPTVGVGGTLPVMMVQYTGRYVSVNGATTEFFPMSKMVHVGLIDDNNLHETDGGFTGENSGNYVEVEVKGIDLKFSEIEIYALEYEAKNAVTKITTLGKQDIQDTTILLSHKGDEVTSTVLLEEILDKSGNISFETCDTLEIKDNILVAGGIKNTEFTESDFDAEIPKGTWSEITGGQSAGYDGGNGIRVQLKPVDIQLTDNVKGDSEGHYEFGSGDNKDEVSPEAPYLDISSKLWLRKTFQRDETYRIGIQWVDKNGVYLFNQFVGDLKMPSPDKLVQWSEDGTGHVDTLGMRNTIMKFENASYTAYVRYLNLIVSIKITPEFLEKISGYRITHVERTRYNSTVLDQGIMTPLVGMNYNDGGDNFQFFGNDDHTYMMPGLNGPYATRVTTSVKTNGGETLKGYNSSDGLYSYDSPRVYLFGERGIYTSPNIKISEQEFISLLDYDGNVFHNYGTKDPLKGGDLNYNAWFLYSLFLSVKGGIISESALDKNIDIDGQKHALPGAKFNLSELSRTGAISSSTEIPSPKIINASLVFKNGRYFSYGPLGYIFISQSEGIYNNNQIYGANTMFLALNGKTGFSYYSYFDESKRFHVDVDDFGGTPHPDGETVNSLKVIANVVQELNEQYSDDVYLSSTNRYIASSEFHSLTNQIEYEATVEGDRYMTLFQHLKYGRQGEAPRTKLDKSATANGWAFGVVLESEIPYELTSGYKFNKDGVNTFSMDNITINETFLSNDSIVSYRVKPYNFKPISNLKNTIAASRVKVNGEHYDSWSQFPVFDFHELDRKYGDVKNMIVFLDSLFTIQEDVVSFIGMNSRALLTPSDGKVINIATGTGTIFEYHKNIGTLGTKFRNNVVITKHGAFFIDEKRNEICLINGQSVDELLESSFNKLLLTKNISKLSLNVDDRETEVYFSVQYTDGTEEMIMYDTVSKTFSNTLNFASDISISGLERMYHIKNNEMYEFGVGANNIYFQSKEKSIFKFVVNPNPENSSQFQNFIGVMDSVGDDINNKLKFSKITFIDNNGNTATVDYTDRKYRIREGKHVFPIRDTKTLDEALNGSNVVSPRLRGQWMEVLVEFTFIDYENPILIDTPTDVSNSSYWCVDGDVVGCSTGVDTDVASKYYGLYYIDIPDVVLDNTKAITERSNIEIDDIFMFEPEKVKIIDYVRIYDMKFKDVVILVGDTVRLSYSHCGLVSDCNDTFDTNLLINGNTLHAPVFNLESDSMIYDHDTNYVSSLVLDFKANRSYFSDRYSIDYRFDSNAWVNVADDVSFSCSDLTESFTGEIVEFPYEADAPDITLELRIKAISNNTAINDSGYSYISKTVGYYDLGHYSQKTNGDC